MRKNDYILRMYYITASRILSANTIILISYSKCILLHLLFVLTHCSIYLPLALYFLWFFILGWHFPFDICSIITLEIYCNLIKNRKINYLSTFNDRTNYRLSFNCKFPYSLDVLILIIIIIICR